jgi:hypothetical protein
MEIECVVSGSFKRSKGKIDQIIEEFEEGGVQVLSPTKGGLFLPARNSLWTPGTYPLKSELHLSEFSAKDWHLKFIKMLDPHRGFLYVAIEQGLIGMDTAREMGFALSSGLKVYGNELVTEAEFDYSNLIDIKSPSQVINIWKD